MVLNSVHHLSYFWEEQNSLYTLRLPLRERSPADPGTRNYREPPAPPLCDQAGSRALPTSLPPRGAGNTSARSWGSARPLPAPAVASSCCGLPCLVGRMAPGRGGHSTESRRPPHAATAPRSFSLVAGDGGGWVRSIGFPCSSVPQRRGPPPS